MAKMTGVNRTDNSSSIENRDVVCIGKDCSKTGTYYLTIIFLKRSGWFCTDCAHFLKSNDLIHCEPSLHELEYMDSIKEQATDNKISTEKAQQEDYT